MVVLAAPALTSMGIPPLLAHFFVFYFGVLSFLTPPVCLAAYAAASLAGANMIQTAFQSMRLGIAAYIVPFIFAYKPALLLVGSPLEVIEACGAAILGISFIAMGLEGYLFRPMHMWKRSIFILGGLILMVPGLIFDAIGLCMILPLFLTEWKSRKYQNMQKVVVIGQ
jgi:TRAP-type uncharacterized transport system fused permease subunit